jgi:hypothetical protein
MQLLKIRNEILCSYIVILLAMPLTISRRANEDDGRDVIAAEVSRVLEAASKRILRFRLTLIVLKRIRQT